MISRYLFIGSIVYASSTLCAPKEITSAAQYTAAYKADKPAVFFFYGTHCGPCKSMKPHYQAVSSDASFKDITFYLINSSNDALESIMDKLNIQSIPTLMCSHNGKTIIRHTGGLTAEGIKTKLNEFFKKVTCTPSKEEPKKEPLRKKTKKLDVTI